MSSVRLLFDGMDELTAALKALPAVLAEQSASRVRFATQVATSKLKDRYEEHRYTGTLASKVTSSVTQNGSSVVGIVRSNAKHAWMFENGTQARHTESGANRGAMPPAHAAIPVMSAERRAMYHDLKDIIAAQGLVVSGDA